MKHHLSTVRRSPWLRVACLLILALMCAPAVIAAIEDKTLPMSQRLGVALKALKRIAPAEQFAKVKADFAKVAVEAAKGTAKEGELFQPAEEAEAALK